MPRSERLLAEPLSLALKSDTGDLRTRFFDSHFHVIDPRFPLIPNQGYLPPFFTIADYRARTAHFRVAGGAVVSASFQGFDQRYLVAAIHELGPNFVGVTQLEAGTSDVQILELDEVGVRAVRFNLYRGGSESLASLEELAHRVFDLVGWHVEIYIASRDLADLVPRLLTLPAVSIDHLGLTAEGMPDLLRLVEHGVCVKASGFGRCDFAVVEALRSLYAANPGSLLFGTDLPSTRAPRPFIDEDVSLILDTLGEEAGRRVLFENACAFYQLA
jgi:predicted TIM-barrel fold metal-dependent hydrolase